jgi:hypothetical protein
MGKNTYQHCSFEIPVVLFCKHVRDENNYNKSAVFVLGCDRKNKREWLIFSLLTSDIYLSFIRECQLVIIDSIMINS